ncbi:hypothetical protein RD110_11075 [Rhodoferax koreense]|uniref:Uncharacterized protein n=1 Tax=Rhodoferax koreensis TaxID=1842727 RepID=A0A1P8JV75_9BURK|nr:hypothetical protein [Rhodoferax koreense]APW37669.1 hypothetical protein RD110_11075 [Rhodoferax koreense]
MTTDIDTKMQRCLEFLRPIALPAEKKADHAHWIAARNADPEQGEDYCRACCQKEVDRLNAENPDGEYLVDGGWGSESDTSGVCSGCGEPLHVGLTEHGVSSELEHFERHRINLRGTHAPYTAFYLVATLESAFIGDVDKCSWLRGHQADHVKRNQQGVRKLLRRIDAIRGRMAAIPPTV